MIHHAPITFGPIPSRRLGRSLGINHLPAKHCTYSCVYCQVGPTEYSEFERRAFYPVAEVAEAVTRKVAELRAAGEEIDYLSFVPDGEPTLDVNLGAMIRAVKPLGIPIAVITSGALLWMPEVRAELAPADLVSVKVDSIVDRPWRRVDRPNGRIDFEEMKQGILDFAREYRGHLLSDTMLVAGMNDDEANLEGVAAFLEWMAPHCAYVTAPTRPPAEPWVRPPDEKAIARAYAILSAKVPHVAVLTSEGPGRFTHAGDPAEDLLAILAVHPMREEAVRAFLEEAGGDGEVAVRLVRDGRVRRVDYRGASFLVLQTGSSH